MAQMEANPIRHEQRDAVVAKLQVQSDNDFFCLLRLSEASVTRPGEPSNTREAMSGVEAGRWRVLSVAQDEEIGSLRHQGNFRGQRPKTGIAKLL